MDRAEWERGETTVDLLDLSVVARGCSVPLLWTVMPDCGAIDTAEREELVGRFIPLFGTQPVRFLTADREFIGEEWIGWLLEAKMPFRIRIKASECMLHSDISRIIKINNYGRAR